MMAGIAGESYNLNKELKPLLSDFEQVVSRRPDVSLSQNTLNIYMEPGRI